MNKILIATKNYGKFKEIESILKDLPIHFVNLKELGINDDIEENGETYEENAMLKAKFFCNLSQLPTVADDSGIQVEALKNELGIHTRRWGAGENANDEDWLDFFLNRMKHEKNKKACFFTTLSFLETPKSTPQIFIGKCEGVITEKPEAEYLSGIPLSAVFKPIGFNQVYSALTVEEKGRISHRGRATSLFKEFLRTKFNLTLL